jgi:hypothetical protein
MDCCEHYDNLNINPGNRRLFYRGDDNGRNYTAAVSISIPFTVASTIIVIIAVAVCITLVITITVAIAVVTCITLAVVAGITIAVPLCVAVSVAAAAGSFLQDQRASEV